MTFQPATRRSAWTRAALAATAAGALLALAPPTARSQTVTPTSAGAAQAPSPHDPYIRLVPESVGEWKRTMLRGARGDPDREAAPGAEAEFTRGDVRAAVRVSSPGTAPGTPPAAPVERTTDQGSERIAAEAGGVVRETVRRADGRVDVVLSRGDGVVVSVQAFRTTPAELRAIALGIRPLAR